MVHCRPLYAKPPGFRLLALPISKWKVLSRASQALCQLLLFTITFSRSCPISVLRTSIRQSLRHEKGTQTQTFWSGYFRVGGGVFHVNGWGPKSSIRPSKPGKSNFLGGISRDFAGISRKYPKSLRKNVCVQFPFPKRVRQEKGT